MDVRVAFDCAQQLLVVQQTSNSATRSQNIFATLKAKGGAGPFCHLADCAYTDFGVPLGASLPQVWNPDEATPRECQQLVRLDALCRGKHGGVICIPVCCLVLVGFCDATSRTLHEHNVAYN